MATDKRRKFEMDNVIYAAGNKGKYQIFQSILLLLASFSCSFPIFTIVFIGYVPKHICNQLENSTSFTDHGIDAERIVDVRYESCSIDVVTNTSGVVSHDHLPCINGFQYKSDKEISIVSEWDLVCNRRGLSELSQTILMLGQGVGAVIFTSISDRFGRKPVNLCCHFVMIAASIGVAFATNIGGFIAIRFIIGACQQGLGLTGYAIFVELFTPDIRQYAGCLGGLSWTLSVMLLAPLAYLMQNISWRYFQLATVGAMLYAVVLYWLMDESLRWLVTNKKIEAAKKIIKKICKTNKTDFSKAITVFHEELLLSESSVTVENQPLLNQEALLEKKQSHIETRRTENCMGDKVTASDDKTTKSTVNDCQFVKQEPEKYTVLDIFKHLDVFKTTVILCYIWTVNSLTYYGLFLTSSSMSGNRFLNYFLNALVELPAMVCVFFALNRIGRRRLSIVLHAMSGLSLIISVTLLATVGNTSGGSIASVVFSLLGKFSITASFNCLFIFTPELFPTNMRNAGIGVASAVARIGGMLAPYSTILSQVVIWGPGVVFGISCIIASFLLLFIPETRGRALPTTITEMREWKTKNVKHVT